MLKASLTAFLSVSLRSKTCGLGLIKSIADVLHLAAWPLVAVRLPAGVAALSF